MSTPGGDPYGPPSGPPGYGPPGYGPPGYGPPGYGNQPGYGPPVPGPPPAYGSPAPAEPSSVRTAFLVWVGAMVAYMLAQLVGVLFPPSDEDLVTYFAALGLPPGAQAEALDAARSASGAIGAAGLVVTLVFVGLFVWFGMRVRAGATWARITTAVIAGLGALGGVIGGLYGLFGPLPAGGGSGGILQIVSGVALVLYLVLLFRPPSNAFFAAHGRR